MASPESQKDPHTPQSSNGHAQRHKSAGEIMKEVALTGNPLAWALMKINEGSYEFDPGYVPTGADEAPLLKHPRAYELRKYKVKDLHLDTGENVTAWYKPAEGDFPTIVYCHGNAGSLDSRAAILREFANRGFGVLIAAYPGFKGHYPRPKIEPSEKACMATGHAMVRYLINTKHIPLEKMVIFGESLGGAVALRTAYNLEKGDPDHSYEPLKVPVVVCFATFTSLVKRAKEQFPLLPASLLMDNRFESDQIISKINAPVLLMHGKADEYTSYRHSVDLHKASGKATLALLEGVTHSVTAPDGQTDPAQLKLLLDSAQQYLSEMKMCPPPADNPLLSDKVTLVAPAHGRAVPPPVGDAGWQQWVGNPMVQDKGMSPDTA